VDEEAQTQEPGEAEKADPQASAPKARGGTGPPPQAAKAAGSSPPEPADAPGAVWDDPRIPWSGRPRRVDILCWAGITLSGLYYWALLPFVAPLVGTHPVLLELLNGSTPAIISAAAFARIGHGSLVVVLLASIPGLMKFDFFYWWAGRLWGERIIAILSGRRNRGRRYLDRVQRWGRKFTWPLMVLAPFLPVPTPLVYVVVASAGMGLITFLILDAIGTLLWAGLLAGLGYALGHHAVVVAQAISHYGLWISIGLIVVVVFWQVRSQRRMLSDVARARAPAARGGQGSTAQADGDEAGSSASP
jgi:membrane-associated protein